MRWLGCVALACFAVHGGYHVLHHEAHDLLWACNTACFLIGVSCLLSARTGVAIGLSWLSWGIPMWCLDLATGGAMIPTSPLTHLGGFTVGALAVRRLGWPPDTWWRATIALILLSRITRLLTPRSANVNLAFSVQAGWEQYFPSYGVYFALIVALGAATFFVFERVVVRLSRR
jgi:hypothetical protein